MSRRRTTEEVVALTLRIMPWLRSPDPKVRAAGHAAFNAYSSASGNPLDPDEFTAALAAGAEAARVSAETEQ